MIIKKFQGKTEDEAVEAAKKELGSNVVVMNVKTIRRKGIFAWFKPVMVEVTVALEEEPGAGSNVTVPTTPDVRSLTEAIGKIAPIVERAEMDKTAKEEPSHAKPSEGTAIEEKLDNLQNMIAAKLKEREPDPAPVDKKEDSSIQVSDNKEEKPAKPEGELAVFFDLLRNTMEDNEIDYEYANQILDEAVKTTKEGTPMDVVLAGIYQKMILKFGKAETITAASHGPKTVFFVGPTGVGKTTTIAKIASKFSVEQQKKIALLTADTYRIAAADQLRTYANILEVPFRIIYTIEEMKAALADFKDFDYIFVDTAGHSHQNSEQKNIMGGFIHSVDGLVEREVYLVVSATTKYRDLRSIADAYSEITDYKLIFTKLDETTAFGNLLNLKLYTDASLSYITCGQNVPDDIKEFNAQSTVKLLLGGKR